MKIYIINGQVKFVVDGIATTEDFNEVCECDEDLHNLLNYKIDKTEYSMTRKKQIIQRIKQLLSLWVDIQIEDIIFNDIKKRKYCSGHGRKNY